MDYLPWKTFQVPRFQTMFQISQIATMMPLIYLQNHCRSLKTQYWMRWKAVTLWIPLQQEKPFPHGITRETRSDDASRLLNWYQGCSSHKERIPSPWSWGSRCLPVWPPGTGRCPTVLVPTQSVSTQQYWHCTWHSTLSVALPVAVCSKISISIPLLQWFNNSANPLSCSILVPIYMCHNARKGGTIL